MDKMYEKLNLYGGKLTVIEDDGEDMLRLSYEDGKIIDVGYVKEENKYYITVISEDNIECWNSPLLETEISCKTRLIDAIQKIICEINEG